MPAPLSRIPLSGRMATLPSGRWLAVFLICSGLTITAGCGRRPAPRPSVSPANATSAEPQPNLLPPITLAQPEQRLGTAIVILVDTSGSMLQPVDDQSGHPQPKYKTARMALEKVMEVTNRWHQAHSETPLYVGLITFSSETTEVLPIEPFDPAKATAALAQIPVSAGGTAIGLAIEAGFQKLYETGCVRKHLVCITDGENTVSTPPDLMARQLYSQTKGEVEMHFIAFDTDAASFQFLKEVNGSVDEASDGQQLESRLTELYEKRILVEAMPAEALPAEQE